MPAPTPLEAWFAAGFFILIALAVYGRQVRRLVRDGGKVQVEQFDLPELLITFVFAGFFAMVAAAAVLHRDAKDPPVKVDTLLSSSLVFVIFVIGISGFMRFRGLRLRRLFGLDRVPPTAALGWATGLILAAFPLALGANYLTELVVHEPLDPQPLVELFRDFARQRDYAAMGKVIASAVFIAPICEEFLFRGFFYGVWKRYVGPLGAGFLACLLFAAFHTSLSAFAGLFVLAACLNIAYERTGSLIVPVTMHALFNLTSLLVMFGQAQNSAGP